MDIRRISFYINSYSLYQEQESWVPGRATCIFFKPRPNVGRLRRPGAFRVQPCIGTCLEIKFKRRKTPYGWITNWKRVTMVAKIRPVRVTRTHFFFPTFFLKNVKYRCKLREITMNGIRLNIFCLDITLQKSQKLVRHCFVR